LPAGPGVYRFLRSNGDVLYVGKATSLKQRVASHFSSAQRATERALEMLTQVSDIAVTKTESVLEAALLEHGEITRLDPPYNVQLREGDRAAWFASNDLLRARPAPDDEHRIGPLPSRWAVAGLGAIRALAAGAEPTTEMRARATGVPSSFAPDDATFTAGWTSFLADPGATGGATGGESGRPDDEPARFVDCRCDEVFEHLHIVRIHRIGRYLHAEYLFCAGRAYGHHAAARSRFHLRCFDLGLRRSHIRLHFLSLCKHGAHAAARHAATAAE
jgi:hypothetical protein